jgi:hypothetical protein
MHAVSHWCCQVSVQLPWSTAMHRSRSRAAIGTGCLLIEVTVVVVFAACK